MLQKLQEKNPHLPIYSVESEEFKRFGKVLHGFDTKEIVSVAKKIEPPENGSSYLASVDDFETLDIAYDMEVLCYGALPIQVGYCWGQNSNMNAMEWHAANEVNIAVTDLILILGHVWDLNGGRIDSSKFKVFYLPAGTVAEIYASSLHFCPCQVEKGGFGCVVALPQGTNTNLEEKTKDPLLFRKNKWIIAHEENCALIDRGVMPGITGENIKIQYE